ncbi:hypothetical protein [Muricoccus radiodurans]|uniref:hypothetical protein n=1 Tax=Muricoccus radiodurans TaxID=2231721 RepID=UPI003CF94B2A
MVEGWADTRWGMTPAEARVAMPALVAEAPPQPCRDPGEQRELRLDRTEVAGQTGFAWLCFREGRLRSVYLRRYRRDGPAAATWIDDTAERLRADFGEPFELEGVRGAPLPLPDSSSAFATMIWMRGPTRIHYAHASDLLEIAYQSSRPFPEGGRLPREPAP